jgi:hypothetical protein
MPPVNLPPAKNVCPFVAPNREKISVEIEDIGTKYVESYQNYGTPQTYGYYPGQKVEQSKTIPLATSGGQHITTAELKAGDIIGRGVVYIKPYNASSEYDTSAKKSEFIYVKSGSGISYYYPSRDTHHISATTLPELQAMIRDQLNQDKGGVPRSVQPGKDGNVIKLGNGTKPADNKVWNKALHDFGLCK